MNSKRSPKKSSKKSQPKSSARLPKSKPEGENELFPVVGIGASAGGLEAFTQLLNHLPRDTGMAFVLIQHLAPHQESLLTEILSRATQMPVNQVQDSMVVEPNRVYVIPPNKKMTISQGVLNLAPREEIRRPFMTVDIFFVSLAEERGNKAIAVVLSGADSDGSQGLEAIKAAGGITFAQCEETAKVNSMPNTAVATGQVDFILPPQAIAEEIAKISSHPYITRQSLENSIEENPEGNDAVSTIFSLLRGATGVDFTNYKQTTLKRRILRRMALYKLEQMSDYVRYLQAHPTEVTALYQDLLIGVTHFFRDPETFEALASRVFPTIVKDKSPGSPIRIWVAGCSTGEEAYSITICLLEFLADEVIKPPIQIYATDISEMAIDTARNAFYTPSQVANISPERLHRFFVQVEGGYQISKPVRELCVFARQNLINDPPFSRMDLIACRNVLIYLGNSLQRKLLPLFHYGLKATGFLILGPSETVGDFSDLFALIDKKSKIYTRKIAASRLDINPLASSYPLETLNPQPIASEDNWSDLEIQQQADRIILNQYSPVGVIIDNELEILQFRGQTSSYLQPAPGKASFNLLKMAKEGLELELRTAIHLAKRQEIPVTKENLQIRESDRIRQIKIDVIPFKVAAIKTSYFLVLFEDIFPSVPSLPEADRISPSGQDSISDEQQMNQLTHELASTKEHLQSIIEEQQATNQDLRAANEEILSSNEELQSTNEELETAKEEIQAANEELNTINDELHRRNIESNRVSNDLENLLSNINIPILMLGGDLRIRRFTPTAKRIFNLISTDVGRPLSDINHNLAVPDLEQQILEVINTLNLKVEEIQDQEGHWYDLRIRPYRTLDNKIDGAVVVLVEIDALKRSMEQLEESRDYAQAIVETVREPLLVLNLDLQAIAANRSFYETFQVTTRETEQRLIFDLGMKIK
jgi:two-component system CheB/CheR fusion protein